MSPMQEDELANEIAAINSKIRMNAKCVRNSKLGNIASSGRNVFKNF
jgi:hypothetical protein